MTLKAAADTTREFLPFALPDFGEALELLYELKSLSDKD